MSHRRHFNPPRLSVPKRYALGLVFAALFGASVFASPALSATLDCGKVESFILGRAVSVCVALPADYGSRSTHRYPTLYFLHGLFENERSWSERGGQRVLEDLSRQGQLGGFLVVMPDGGKTFYVNSLDGHDRYEDFFIRELVPSIDRKYRTIANSAARGISGTSMGGYGALHLGMSHPDVFGSASAHSAALLARIPNPLPSEGRWGFYARILQGPFGSPLSSEYWEANSPLTLADHPEQFGGLKLYFDCGDHDRYGFEEGAKQLHQKLEANGFPHDFALRPGDHGWSYLGLYMKYSLQFHWQWFKQAAPALTATGKKAGSP
jgi:S-formylglutathione hydrolase FrmB